MPRNSEREEHVRDTDGRLIERHLHRNAKGGTVRADSVFLLDDEDKSDVASVHTVFDNSENLIIEGGFFGINARTAATEYAHLQVQRQIERDRALFELEREKLALQRERMQAEIEIERRRAQLGWSNAIQPQYMPPNAYVGFFPGGSPFYGPAMDGHQTSFAYGQGSGFPSLPGLPLHSQSNTQVPQFPEAHPAPPPPFLRAQTESDARQAHPFVESDSTTHTNTHRLKEKLPEAPRHIPQSN